MRMPAVLAMVVGLMSSCAAAQDGVGTQEGRSEAEAWARSVLTTPYTALDLSDLHVVWSNVSMDPQYGGVYSKEAWVQSEDRWRISWRQPDADWDPTFTWDGKDYCVQAEGRLEIFPPIMSDEGEAYTPGHYDFIRVELSGFVGIRGGDGNRVVVVDRFEFLDESRTTWKAIYESVDSGQTYEIEGAWDAASSEGTIGRATLVAIDPKPGHGYSKIGTSTRYTAWAREPALGGRMIAHAVLSFDADGTLSRVSILDRVETIGSVDMGVMTSAPDPNGTVIRPGPPEYNRIIDRRNDRQKTYFQGEDGSFQLIEDKSRAELDAERAQREAEDAIAHETARNRVQSIRSGR
ncbi:MAG: hypothetical protein RBS39_05870 [Phycisphaerales bacterium]|nr:hypothetical protein [Phycisphaerales bacterium]